MAYDARWEADAETEVPVGDDDERCKDRVKGHGNHDLLVDRALDEAERERPSAVALASGHDAGRPMGLPSGLVARRLLKWKCLASRGCARTWQIRVDDTAGGGLAGMEFSWVHGESQIEQ